MARFNPLEVLKAIMPSMIWHGLIHPCRTAVHVAHSTRPELRGLPRLRAIFQAMNSPLPQKHLPDTFEFLGNATQIDIDERHCVTITADRGTVRLVPLAENLVQIRVRSQGPFQEPFSYAIEKQEDEWEPAGVSISETDEAVELSTPALTIIVNKHPYRLTVQDKAGNVLLHEIDGAGHHPDDDQVIWRAALGENAAYYGLGEKAVHLNLAGRSFELWNTDLSGYDRGDDPIYMSIPFVLALSDGHAVGLFFDNSYRAWLDLGAATSDILEYRAAGGEFRLYLMTGTPSTILECYTELTGRMTLPPLWALGLHQSRWSYYPQARVMEIAREFRQRRLPCDVIHFDIHYMDGYRCFTWDKKRFPDPRELLNVLHSQGFKGLSMIDPGIKVDPGYWVYKEGMDHGAFITFPDGTRFTGPVWPGDCHFPDFTAPAVREWWGDLYKGLLDAGMDAFWNDMNEIALITLKIGTTVPDVVHHDHEGRGATHAEDHNVYGMLMARASREGLQRLRPDHRPLILTRSGWAGVQRYAMHWTGDNKSTWDHLRLSIQMVLNLGISGVAMTGPDVGGFTGGPPLELFARWMQVGAFTPFFRVHSMTGSPDQEPWAFGPEVEAISRKYLELRYQLLPYIYTAVWQATRTGIPVARALSLVYPDDPLTYNLDDQYLFGDSILVAPVLDAGVTRREVYLPAGEWYDFWSRDKYQGGQTITAQAPLDTLPLFVKAGSIIPIWPVQQYVGEQPIDTLSLHAYWASGEHVSVLYEDDGIRPDYEAPEAHRVSRFTLSGVPDGFVGSVTRLIEEGQYDPALSRIRLHVIGLEDNPSDVKLAGGTLHSQIYDPGTSVLTVDLDAPFNFGLSLG